MIKLCKECRWCKNPGEFAECRAPQNKKNINKQTGFEEERRYNYCSTQRSSLLGGWISCRLDGACGVEGRWWESK